MPQIVARIHQKQRLDIGGPYRLTARTLVDSEVAHVGREDFLELMRRDSALCLEATAMLVRELSFIHQAIHEASRISARGAETRFMVEKLPSRVVRN
jgi:CRP-like cAMP-binding protein